VETDETGDDVEASEGAGGFLTGKLGRWGGDVFDESKYFLQLNHYRACRLLPKMSRLVPHMKSDFLTVLYQNQVGGLQLLKGSRWVAVKPN